MGMNEVPAVRSPSISRKAKVRVPEASRMLAPSAGYVDHPDKLVLRAVARAAIPLARALFHIRRNVSFVAFSSEWVMGCQVPLLELNVLGTPLICASRNLSEITQEGQRLLQPDHISAHPHGF